MITRNFIEKIHYYFDELNYHETKKLNFDAFEQAASRTLTHSKELSDAIETVRMYQFCLKKWNQIESIFNRKLHIFNEYDYEGNSLISVISDEEAGGTYYITNGINKKVKEIFVATYSDEDEIFSLDFTNGKFSIYRDGNYYIKYANMTSDKMKLFNQKKECLCNIVLSNNLEIFLENNYTPYELIVYDEGVGIYDRKYIESLADTDFIDTENLLADIEWDILDKNSDLGVAKLNVYEADLDLELLLFFATSTFLLYQHHRQSQRAAMFYLASH